MNTITADLLPLAVDIATLNVLRDNPRRGDVEAVRKSYEQFGQRKPIVARRDDRVVLAGNHQLLAARELGWPEIAVVWVDDDDATAMAFTLADNRTADLGTYDNDLLAALIAGVAETGIAELLGATGYDDKDLRDILAGGHAGAPGSAEYLEPQPDLYVNQYGVTVVCKDEQEQEAMYNRFIGEGLSVRVVTV